MLGSLLGTIPQWLTVVALVGAAVVIVRGSAGSALGIERSANRTLRERLSELEGILRERDTHLAALEGKTNLEPLLIAFAELQRGSVKAARAHEERAQSRFEQTTVILGLIAEKLGPNDD